MATSDPLRRSVLVVEDDRDLSAMLADLLGEEGYAVDVAADGQRGLHLALTGDHDVLVIDRGLPVIDGVDLVKRLRRKGVSAPVMMLTARGTVADRVEGLDAGAEDYLVKPFDVEELLARVRALLRRHVESADALPLGRRQLVVSTRQVVGDGSRAVDLSQRECMLLEQLARWPSRVHSREELLETVFGEAEALGSVDTYVHYLRRKLGRDCVRTVRGLGYRLGSA